MTDRTPRARRRLRQTRTQSPGLMAMYHMVAKSGGIRLPQHDNQRVTRNQVQSGGSGVTVVIENGGGGSSGSFAGKVGLAFLGIAVAFTLWYMVKPLALPWIAARIPAIASLVGQPTTTVGGQLVSQLPPFPGEPASNSGSSFDSYPSGDYELLVEKGLYIDQREQLFNETATAWSYVVSRWGQKAAKPFKAAFSTDSACGLHGIAHTTDGDGRTVQSYTCDSIGRSRAIVIMAHEFVHQLEQDRYGAAHLHSDTILAEGAATWAAGKYWLGDTQDFRTYVRNQRRSGVFYPLVTDYNGLGIGAMNALYYEWASFCEYLIGEYGREKFDKVYVLGASGIGTADYMVVYGKDLNALSAEWEAWIGT
jgi:hypothetical protein